MNSLQLSLTPPFSGFSAVGGDASGGGGDGSLPSRVLTLVALVALSRLGIYIPVSDQIDTKAFAEALGVGSADCQGQPSVHPEAEANQPNP